ncbi:MAG: aminotransferase class I/II-fold pyridoxal phosphate-dependent enzyme [Alphaproteobacteria bacterium]|nr:aminotransferase class I/II-fold pyridoxal phosphate-dependent enzyme [Alphaproteobacteria bacterium]
MTIWLPELGDGRGGKARALADAIGAAIAEGRLRPGDRLPPQRELAWQLHVSLGTVTRGYDAARRRGLVEGHVGSGTYVCEPERPGVGFVLPADGPAAGGAADAIDLSVDVYASPLWTEPFRHTLTALGADDASALLEYQSAAGMMRHREAAASWLRRPGFAPDAEDIVLTAGGQHALAIALSALGRPGDTLLVENLCYPPVKTLAEMYGLTLHGVALDGEGAIPDALEAACRSRAPRLLYLTPTLQNPTNAVMGAARRAEIVEIARRHDLLIVEDDVTGALSEDAPKPLTALAPERCCFVSSFSKTVAPGLRTGFLVAPAAERERVLSRARALGWMAPPVSCEIASRWIGDGTADRLREAVRRENRRRHEIAASVLDGLEESGSAAVSPHAWYRLPERWRSSGFVEAAQAHGVRIACTRSFAVNGRAGTAVRISLSAAESRETLRRALAILARIGRGMPAADLAIL